MIGKAYNIETVAYDYLMYMEHDRHCQIHIQVFWLYLHQDI
jgi:hypothetical protein